MTIHPAAKHLLIEAARAAARQLAQPVPVPLRVPDSALANAYEQWRAAGRPHLTDEESLGAGVPLERREAFEYLSRKLTFVGCEKCATDDGCVCPPPPVAIAIATDFDAPMELTDSRRVALLEELASWAARAFPDATLARMPHDGDCDEGGPAGDCGRCVAYVSGADAECRIILGRLAKETRT